MKAVALTTLTATLLGVVPTFGAGATPPNQRASKVIPFPFQACSRKGPIYLSVAAVQKGR
jgi:hypothetical protein